MLRWRHVSAVLLVVASCSSGSGSATDAGPDATADGAQPDAGFEVAAPAPPAAPAALALTPCPPGWRADRMGELEVCDPWPADGPADCAAGAAHFAGEPGCRTVGADCPAGEWPEGLPADRAILHVRAGAAAGGTGEPDAPFASIAEAMNGARDGTIVAIAAGTYREAVSISDAITLWGVCAARTTIESDVWSDFSGVVTATANEVEIRNLTISGARAGVIASGPRTVLRVQGVVVDGTTRLGILAAAGATLEVGDVQVRAIRARGDISRAFQLEAGAQGGLARVVIEGGSGEGVVLIGADTFARLEDVAVRDTWGGAGIFVGSGGSGQIVRASIVGAVTQAVAVQDPGSDADLEDVVMRDGRAGASGRFGWGLSVGLGAHVEGRRLLVADNRDTGIGVRDESSATLEDTAVLRTQPDADGESGEGLVVTSASSVDIQRIWIEGNRDAGIRVADAGSSARIQDAVVRDTDSVEANGLNGFGVLVVSEATLDLARALVADNHYGGISVGAAAVTLSDLEVRGTMPRAFDGTDGRGLGVQEDSALTLMRALVSANHEVGVFVADEGTRATLSDLTITDTRSVDGSAGRGLSVQDGATVEGERIALERNRELNLFVAGGGSRARLVEARIVDALERECDRCGNYLGGVGAGSYVEGAIELERFVVSRAALAGLQLARGGTIDLSDGEVSSSPVGVNIQTEDFDVNRLSERVAYFDNGRNLDSTELPVPQL